MEKILVCPEGYISILVYKWRGKQLCSLSQQIPSVVLLSSFSGKPVLWVLKHVNNFIHPNNHTEININCLTKSPLRSGDIWSFKFTFCYKEKVTHFPVSCCHQFRINLSSNPWKAKGSYLILSFKLSHGSVNFNDVPPGVPCLSVLLKSPKPLAVKEDAFVFSVVFSCRSFFVAFDMISVLIYAELRAPEQPKWIVYSLDCATCSALVLVYLCQL